ncbi:MAG: hypothetical protein ACR2P5_01200 [Gammaproteobacteria bacterium]
MRKTHMEKEDDMQTLGRRVEMLCARCEALSRELRNARGENRRLLQKSETAKQKLRNIVAQIPEIGDIG